LLAATLYQGNPDRKHKLWNIVSTERYIHHIQELLECYYICVHINGKFTMGKLKSSVLLVEQELLTLPEHLSSLPVLVEFVLLDH
jgi:hypothetical protein